MVQNVQYFCILERAIYVYYHVFRNRSFYSTSRDYNQPIVRSEFDKVLSIIGSTKICVFTLNIGQFDA